MKFLAFPAQVLTEFAASSSVPLAIVLGNFDGVHCGHQALLQEAQKTSKVVLALTFQPHPVAYLKQQDSFLLTSYEQRADYLAQYGASYLCALDFAAICKLSPQEFIAKFLAVLPPPVTLVVGENFHFGYQQQGTPQTLIEALPQFKVKVVPLKKMATTNQEEMPVSSGRIRQLLREGQMQAVNLLLGHSYQLQGIVRRGQGLARQLNFPTANLALPPEQLLPPAGVYISTLIYQGQRMEAISYCGTRPTIARNLPPLLETHLLGHNLELYERFIQVELHLQLRPEFKFDSYSTLQDQITTDIHQARAWHQEQIGL